MWYLTFPADGSGNQEALEMLEQRDMKDLSVSPEYQEVPEMMDVRDFKVPLVFLVSLAQMVQLDLQVQKVDLDLKDMGDKRDQWVILDH